MRYFAFLQDRKTALTAILSGLLGGALAFSLNQLPSRASEVKPCGQYRFTNQLLDCQTFFENSARIGALEVKLNEATSLFIKNSKAKRVSVWVRDLVTNQPAGSNETNDYAPASLFKLPLMLAYYKVAEAQPSILTATLPYEKPSALLNNSSQDFIPSDPLIAGKTYTISELLRQMVVNSDNDAAALLLSHIDQSIFTNTLVDLGLRIPSNAGTVDFITAKNYANIFRILYNASYLSRDNSEKVLDILTGTSFDGLTARLPHSVPVAHKFGEREVDSPTGLPPLRELHDCGIVYKKPDPYSICIMTEGYNFDDLLSIIRDLSQLVYQQM